MSGVVHVSVAGKTVTLGPHLSTLETGHNKVLYYFTFTLSAMTIKGRTSAANTICSLILCCMHAIHNVVSR